MPLQYTPWLLLQEEGYDIGDTCRSIISNFHFHVLHSFHTVSSCNHLVSDLFHSHACGCFSAFVRTTCSLSVSGQYLGLEFNAPIFARRIKAELLYATQPTAIVYEVVTLYDCFFQNIQLHNRSKSCATSPPLLQGGIRYALRRFHSRY